LSGSICHKGKSVFLTCRENDNIAEKLTCEPRSIMMDKYISLRMYMRSISSTCGRRAPKQHT